jgi:hypothetical protein
MDIKFNTYIKLVLKQVHPNISISSIGLSEVDGLLHNLTERIIKNVNNTLVIDGAEAVYITAKMIQDSVKIIMPGELAKHAISEGTKAVTKFNAYIEPYNWTPSQRAGLQFSVVKITQLILHHSNNNPVEETAAVYLAAVIEYIALEILYLSGDATQDKHRVRIMPLFIRTAINNDEELQELFKKIEK